MSKDIEPEMLRHLLRYEPETGKLFWLPRTEETGGKRFRQFNKQFAGKEALYGNSGSHGYRMGAIFNRQYLTHRVVWALVNGAWPSRIDHINGDKTDNRIANLRVATASENARNCALSPRNKSGVVGVNWAKHAGKWRAAIYTKSGHRHLGYFSDIKSAADARKVAEREEGYHPNHGRLA